MKIGNVQLDNEVFLSPMAGVTDLPFRTICKEKGCGMLCTEMINAKALCYDDENTKKDIHKFPFFHNGIAILYADYNHFSTTSNGAGPISNIDLWNFFCENFSFFFLSDAFFKSKISKYPT